MILIPAYSHVHHQLLAAIADSGVPYQAEHGVSDLPRLRSVMLSRAMRNGVNRVVLIDSDTVPTAAQIRFLAETPLVTATQAVTGMYTMKGTDCWSVDTKGEVPDMTGNEPFPVYGGGLGFCAISCESLRAAAAGLDTVTEENGLQWRPLCAPFVSDGKWFADDQSLWARLQESGTNIICRPDLAVKHASLVLV